jgi:hypothetical protein
MKPIFGAPTEGLLTLSLILSPVVTLISSVLYALNGWDNGTAAAFHIAGGILGIPVVVRLTTYLDRVPRLAATAFAVGMAGCGGVIGYGFNTIGVSLGGVDLIDASGPATILKPLGLCWPLALILFGVALLRAGRVPAAWGAGIVLAGVVFPISRIANLGWLAIAVDLLLLVCLAAMAAALRADTRAPEATVVAPGR